MRMFKPLRSLIHDRSFRALLLVVIIILLGGMFFYSRVEHWRLLDGLYFSVITLTTVGYGDLSPTTDASKIFTIIYIFFGVGIILAFITIIARITSKHYTHVSENYMKQLEVYVEDVIKNTIGKIGK